MAESSTPNPFEPELPKDSTEPKPDPEQTAPEKASDSPPSPGLRLKPIVPEEPEDKQQKLKLKQILTPLSPHLTAPRPETPESAPKKKAYTPSPKAVPVEPEPELTEDELAARASAGGPKVVAPSAEIETSPPTPEELGLKAEEEQAEQPATEEGNQPQAEKKTKAAKKAAPPKPKARKVVLALLVPVVLLAAIAYFVNSLFDPLGLKIQPIEQLPDLALKPQSPEAKSLSTEASDSSQFLDAIEKESIEDYLTLLEEQAVLAASSQDGLFINAVYYRSGAVLNPRYGLTLVSIDGDSESILLEDAEGQSYRIAMR
ncbi:MAG: hypothetical protein AB3N33_05130 [Puniceicoccaceae bacterium]